jgi:hypothetical protein
VVATRRAEMKKDDAAKLPEHPVLSKLTRERAMGGTAFRGYVGPSSDEDHVTLYSSLESPRSSIEIARADIIHSEDIPEHFKPFGAKVVWVRNNATATVRHFVEIQSGRLKMKKRPRSDDDDCSSPCATCSSPCGSECMSSCYYDPPDPDDKRKKKKGKKKKYA